MGEGLQVPRKRIRPPSNLERGPIAKRKRMRDQAGMNTPVQTCHASSVFATSERIM